MPVRKIAAAVTMGLALSLAAPALANDSTAELAAGGLVLTRDDDIEMRSEDLFISREEVVVKYRFLNTAAADKTVRVAFPMPDVEYSESDIGIPTEDPENLLGFTTLVDGRAVTAEVEQRAWKGDTDVTARLRALGVPIQPHLGAAIDAMDGLPQAVKDELVRDELAGVMEYDAGKGWEKHLFPMWRLSTAYHWEQTFPAGRELAVEHRYKPAAGGSAGTSIGSPWSNDEPGYRDYIARFCVDDDFLAGVSRARRDASMDYPPFTETRISYVLKTGGNWKKPIGRFRLVVDKGAAANLVSFCASGVRKISPTRFEVVREDYTPEADLDILVLERVTPAE